LAEGVGLLPTIGKSLKINGRFRASVSQDYRISVTAGKGQFFNLGISHDTPQFFKMRVKAER
jgi:hypothetical protein